MKIGQVAELTGVTTPTIRYYESIGLVDPPQRTASGYRQYDERTVERLRFVRDAQATGLSLIEIRSVLEMKASGARTCSHTTALLERHLADLDVQIERLTAARAELLDLAERARGLDPADCTDPNRCQVIDVTHEENAVAP
jgi:DNA-binding transcriptional MerR regulator